MFSVSLFISDTTNAPLLCLTLTYLAIKKSYYYIIVNNNIVINNN